ncbi:MAG: permease-like cell division protein FtsX [Patescibacteria group bacterium]
MSKALSKVLQNVNKEKLFTASNLVVMTLTFLVFGLFVLIEVLSQTALGKLEKEAAVTIFFKDDFGESQILNLKSQIEKDKRVYSVKYVSKDDAFNIFKELNKNEPLLLESVTASVLPASLEVRAVKVSLLNTLSDEYSKLEGVEGVKFFKDIIERFNFWRGVLSLAVGVVLVILLFVSFSIVVSTVRTAISLRGAEFEILKLVGASDAYVKNPLIHQGVLYGGVSAFIAGLVYAVLIFVALFSGFLGSLGITDFALVSSLAVPAWIFAIVLTLVLTLCGALLGYISSTSAVKKYLNY